MTRTLEINTDQKCPRCGKKGATRVDGSAKYGVCLDCALKSLAERQKRPKFQRSPIKA